MDFAWVWIGALGVGAGIVTTVAGMGGGMLLVLAISATHDPHTAFAVTTPSLLVSNSHRAWLFRRQVVWPKTRAFVLGAFPAAVFGAWFSGALDPQVLRWILLAVAGLAVVRAAGGNRLAGRLPDLDSPVALGVAGFVVGAVAATSGAGILVAPVLLAAGLTGEAYVATVAMAAVALHLARMIGYGFGGLLDLDELGWSAALGVGLILGNLAGRGLRRRLRERTNQFIAYGVLAVVVSLAMVGLR